MPPPLPQTPGERDEMWGHVNSDADPLDFDDPEEPANHLDRRTQNRIVLFPEMSSMLHSRFGYSRETDRHWFPVRPLGKGGFGGVAVWERRNLNGDVLEETAVKQSKWSAVMALNSKPFLAKEAAIMQQLNKRNSDNIVYLKGFKIFQEQKRNKATWRFYFEYCPHGDLSRLQKRYKAWGTYLPEEFLWRTFHSMALVAQIMDDGSYDDLETGQKPRFPYILIHSDIKPLNIFLGYHTDPKSPWHVYPVVKVGDWGLASLTNSLDPANPHNYIKRGTAMYLPPESRAKRDIKKYETWKNPPFHHKPSTASELVGTSTDPDQTDRQIDSSHNIWAFGMTMHELLTHQRARDFSERMNAMTEDEYNAWGQNTIPTIATHKQPEYSHNLRHLIRQCLNLRASLRPTIQQVLQKTGSMIEYYEQEMARDDGQVKNWAQEAASTYQLPKLYFNENEINHMPLGRHLEHFGIDNKQQAEFALEQDKYAEPVWGPILHPNRALWAGRYRELWQHDIQQDQNHNGKRAQNAIDVSSGEVFHFDRNRLRPPAGRPAKPTGRRRGLDRVVRANHNPKDRPRAAKQDGFAADQARRRPAQGDQPRKRQRRLDSVDELLLTSGSMAHDEEQSRRNVRHRRMRLWDGRPPARGPSPLEETLHHEEDYPMADDDEWV